MRSDTIRVVVIILLLLAVGVTAFSIEEYHARKQISHCREYAITAFSEYVRTPEYASRVKNLEKDLHNSLSDMHGKELSKFAGVLASYNIDDEFTQKKFQECQLRHKSLD